MRKISVFTGLLLIIGLFSCQPGDGLEDLIASELDITGEAAVASSYEEVDEIVDDGMEYCQSITSSERLEHFRRFRFGRLSDCVEIDRDTINHVITLDFGDGCEGPYGTVRKGVVKIAYSDVRNVPGAYRTVTFENFFVDSVGVEGTRTITNISEEDDSLSRSFEIALVAGKLTFADETTITRSGNHVRTSHISADKSEAYSTLTGEASGTLRNGDSYTVTIVEEIVYSAGCREEHVVIPVSGVKEIVSGDNLVTIDFGDGTCDNLVEITINGETTTREIEPRGRRHRRK